MLTAAKYIGAGLATIGLAGAGVALKNFYSCPSVTKVSDKKLTQNGEVLNTEDNTVDKNCSDVFLAWTAGFFEADGCIICYVDKARGYKFSFRVRVIIKLSQKSNLVLNDIRKELELGNIFKNKAKDNKLNYYDLIIANQNDVLTFINLIRPYVRFKHHQLEIGKQILKQRKDIASVKDLLKLAKLADSLSVLNDKSTNDGKKYYTMIKEHFNL